MVSKKQQYNTVTASASGTTDWIPTDPAIKPFEVSCIATYAGGSTLTYTVEYTVDPMAEITDSLPAIDLPEMIDLNSTVGKAIIGPITGVRLNVTAFTSGSVTLKVRQSGVKQ